MSAAFAPTRWFRNLRAFTDTRQWERGILAHHEARDNTSRPRSLQLTCHRSAPATNHSNGGHEV
eukprot:5023423-Amphidinium_carterae.1